MWLKFKEWADKYGPIYETSMMGQRFIVIADEGIAQELLIKKGNHFAGRTQIRALLNHRAGPVYVALQDRNGKKQFNLTFHKPLRPQSNLSSGPRFVLYYYVFY